MHDRRVKLTLHSHAAVALGRKLFPLFALALNLPEDFFDDKVTQNVSDLSTPDQKPQTKNAAALMRVLHYPPQSGPVDNRTVGIGAHTE